MFQGLKGDASKFGGVYKDAKGEMRPCFNLPKRECLILVSYLAFLQRSSPSYPSISGDKIEAGGIVRETKYMKQKNVATGPSGESIERIFVKGYQRDEIRFSWWPEGRFVPRALDVTEDELLPLFADAMKQDVFTPEFLKSLQAAIAAHLKGGAV